MFWKHKYFAIPMMVMLCGFYSKNYGQEITLDQAIEEALTNNPSLLKAEIEMKSARARVWEGISPDYPEVFMEFEGVPEGAAWDGYEARKIGIAQEVAFPLAYVYEGRHHHWEAELAQAGWRQVRNSLVADVKTAFSRVLLLEEQIRLQENIARITRETVEKARLRVFAGESSPYDTLKVKVDLAEVENRLAALRAESDVAKASLSGLMHRDEQSVDVVGQLTFSPLVLEAETLKRIALMNHPRVAAVEAVKRREGSQRTLAWMGLLPSFHFKYFQMDVPEAVPSDRWGGEIGMKIPLWFFTKGQGSIRSAQHRFHAELRLPVQYQLDLAGAVPEQHETDLAQIADTVHPAADRHLPLSIVGCFKLRY